MANGFTDKQRVFIEEYLRCWNGSEAARIAEYAHPRQEASRLLSNANIRAEIDARISEKAMTADEVLVRLAEQARGAAEVFIEVKGTLPFLNWQRLQEAGGLRLVKKLKYDSNGRPEVEFYDAQAALVQLGRAHGLFTDKTEVTGKDGGPIVISNLGMSTDEL